MRGVLSDIMTQIWVYTQDEGQRVITAISMANKLEKQKILKAGLRNIIEVTTAGVLLKLSANISYWQVTLGHGYAFF